MSMGLSTVTLPRPGPMPQPLDSLEASHGVGARGGRMYTRFFGQDHVLMAHATHAEMLRDTLQQLVDGKRELAALPGILCYAKTQTHNTPAEIDWLRAIADAAGLSSWEVTTVSMTNCASALAAVHGFAEPGRPLLVLAGEKAFHSTGNRLSVGLLGEAPAAALFLPGAGRRVRFSKVRHAPRFFRNPDDMAEADRRALQSEFEIGFEAFLADCLAKEPAYFACDPVFLPYNLNVPLVMRVLDRLGLAGAVHHDHSGCAGHCFCSDPFLNLAALPVSSDRPVFLFCAGMGVTYAALALGPVPRTPQTPPSLKSGASEMSHTHLNTLREALAEVLECDVPELTPEMEIDREFDLDSVMFVQFLLSIEDRVPGLRFDPEVLAEAAFNNVASLLEFLDGAVTAEVA